MPKPQVIPGEISEIESRSEKAAGHLFAGVLTVVVMTSFLGFIFNRYLPINEGWFHYYAEMMHQGKMPYRDFYYFGQPVPLFLAWLLAGDHLINLRVFGLIEHIVLSGMLYFLLSRQFSPRASFLATVVALMVFMTYISEAFFTFLVDSLFLFVAGLICVYEAQTHPPHERLWILLSGICASLSFFSKQTTGFFATLAIMILLAWFGSSVANVVRAIVHFCIGWCSAATPIIAWLSSNRALQPYWNEAFKGAAATKGSLRTVLFTTLGRSFSISSSAILAVILILVGLAVWDKSLKVGRPQDRAATKTALLLTGALAILVIFVPLFGHAGGRAWGLMRFYMWTLSQVTFLAMTIAVIWTVLRRIRSPTPSTERVMVILIVGGFLWAYGSQMSFMVEQHSIILGLVFFVAVAFDCISSGSGKSLAGLMTVCCLIQIGESAFQKYQDAFDWQGWRSSITRASVSSQWPQLTGYKVDQRTVTVIDAILGDVVHTAKPGEAIFTFPHIPMFNVLTGHPQPTFCPVHYWDVCPDEIAEADAVRIKMARPAVIVVMDMSEWLWKDGELAFREGRRSGQRSIQAAIEELVSSGDYRLLHTFETPHYKESLKVWGRIK